MRSARTRLLAFSGLVFALLASLMLQSPTVPRVDLVAQPDSVTRADDSESLPPGAVARIGSNRFQHPVAIIDLVVSADGRTVYTTAGTSAFAWELETGRLKWRTDALKATSAIREVGERVWVGPNPTVELSRTTGRLVETWPEVAGEHDLWPTMAGHPSRRFVYSIGEPDKDRYRPVTIRDCRSTNPPLTVRSSGQGWSTLLAPDGRSLAINLGWRNNVLYSTETAKRIGEMRDGDDQVELGQLAFSPDGLQLVSAVWKWGSMWVEARPVAGGTPRRLTTSTWSSGSHVPYAVRFSPDGKWIAVFDSRTWEFRDFTTGRLFHAVPASGRNCIGEFTPDSSRFVTVTGARKLIVYDPRTGAGVNSPPVPWVSRMRWAADGKLVALAGRAAITWDPLNRRQLDWVPLPRELDDETPGDVDISWDGTHAAYLTQQHKGVSVVDLRTGERWRVDQTQSPSTVGGILQTRATLRFSPDGRNLAIGPSTDIWLSEVASGVVSHAIRGAHPGEANDFTSDGQFLVASSHKGGMRSWKVAAWPETRPLPEKQLLAENDGRVQRLACVPGSHLVVAEVEMWERPDPDPGEDAFGSNSVQRRYVIVWNVATGKQVAKQCIESLLPDEEIHADGFEVGTRFEPCAIVGLPGGKKVAIGDAYGRVVIVEIATGKVSRVFGKLEQRWYDWSDRISALAVSPDGRYIASASNGQILIWDLASKEK
jgi:WD40 repeat protein